MYVYNNKRLIYRFFIILILISLSIPFFSIKSAADSSVIVSGQTYYIRNYYTGKYMTVAGSTNDSNVYQYKFTGSSNQKFTLSAVYGNGSSALYNIKPLNATNMYLDINNNSSNNGTNVKIHTYSSNYQSAQRFYFISNGDGTYKIVPLCGTNVTPNAVVEVAGPSTSDYANIQIWGWVGSVSQKWVIEKVTNPDTYEDMCWNLPFSNMISNNPIHVETGGHTYYDLDFSVPYGTELFCTAPAKVLDAGGNNSMGNYVIVEFDRKFNNQTLTGRFLHLKQEAYVTDDQHITYCNLMGYVGNTGLVYPEPTPENPHAGTHLHLDINTAGQLWGNYLNFNNTIPPEYFFPYANFQ